MNNNINSSLTNIEFYNEQLSEQLRNYIIGRQIIEPIANNINQLLYNIDEDDDIQLNEAIRRSLID